MPILFVQDLDERYQAIGGAGCIRNHRMAGFENTVIHAVDDRRIHIVAPRRGNQDFFRTRRNVRRRLGFAREQAGALEHKIHAEFGPRQFRRIALRHHADAIAVDHHGIAVDMHFAVKSPMHGVVASQMRIGIGIAQIVDGDDLDGAAVLALVQRTQDIAADSPVTIDAHFYCHRLQTPFDSMLNRPAPCRLPRSPLPP